MREFHYVIEEDSQGNETLVGHSLSEQGMKELFYADDIPEGHRRIAGCHATEYKTDKKAHTELIKKPNEFNEALKIINKYGFDVYPRHTKTVSYQQHFDR